MTQGTHHPEHEEHDDRGNQPSRYHDGTTTPIGTGVKADGSHPQSNSSLSQDDGKGSPLISTNPETAGLDRIHPDDQPLADEAGTSTAPSAALSSVTNQLDSVQPGEADIRHCDNNDYSTSGSNTPTSKASGSFSTPYSNDWRSPIASPVIASTSNTEGFAAESTSEESTPCGTPQESPQTRSAEFDAECDETSRLIPEATPDQEEEAQTVQEAREKSSDHTLSKSAERDQTIKDLPVEDLEDRLLALEEIKAEERRERKRRADEEEAEGGPVGEDPALLESLKKPAPTKIVAPRSSTTASTGFVTQAILALKIIGKTIVTNFDLIPSRTRNHWPTGNITDEELTFNGCAARNPKHFWDRRLVSDRWEDWIKTKCYADRRPECQPQRFNMCVRRRTEPLDCRCSLETCVRRREDPTSQPTSPSTVTGGHFFDIRDPAYGDLFRAEPIHVSEVYQPNGQLKSTSKLLSNSRAFGLGQKEEDPRSIYFCLKYCTTQHGMAKEVKKGKLKPKNRVEMNYERAARLAERSKATIQMYDREQKEKRLKEEIEKRRVKRAESDEIKKRGIMVVVNHTSALKGKVDEGEKVVTDAVDVSGSFRKEEGSVQGGAEGTEEAAVDVPVYTEASALCGLTTHVDVGSFHNAEESHKAGSFAISVPTITLTESGIVGYGEASSQCRQASTVTTSEQDRGSNEMEDQAKISEVRRDSASPSVQAPEEKANGSILQEQQQETGGPSTLEPATVESSIQGGHRDDFSVDVANATLPESSESDALESAGTSILESEEDDADSLADYQSAQRNLKWPYRKKKVTTRTNLFWPADSFDFNQRYDIPKPKHFPEDQPCGPYYEEPGAWAKTFFNPLKDLSAVSHSYPVIVNPVDRDETEVTTNALSEFLRQLKEEGKTNPDLRIIEERVAIGIRSPSDPSQPDQLEDSNIHVTKKKESTPDIATGLAHFLRFLIPEEFRPHVSAGEDTALLSGDETADGEAPDVAGPLDALMPDVVKKLMNEFSKDEPNLEPILRDVERDYEAVKDYRARWPAERHVCGVKCGKFGE